MRLFILYIVSNILAMALRTVNRTVPAIEQSEGVGARVRRSIGGFGMKNFSPFLLCDHFKVGGSAGFPEHPHLGQETITLMIKGAFAHEDFTGSKGVLRPGDLQFMTAGRGTVHLEMPVKNKDGSPSEGLQLWVDLPAKLKEVEPRYRDLREWEVPEVITQDGKLKVRVISGSSYGAESDKDLAYAPVEYYHYTLKPGASFEQKVPEDFNFFLYVFEGKNLVLQENTRASQYDNVFFNADGDTVKGYYPESEKGDLQFMLIGGQILKQTLVHHGPFVALTRERIQQAFQDYLYARGSFARVKTWKTLISGGVTEEMVNGPLNGSLEARAAAKKKWLEEHNKVKDEL